MPPMMVKASRALYTESFGLRTYLPLWYSTAVAMSTNLSSFPYMIKSILITEQRQLLPQHILKRTARDSRSKGFKCCAEETAQCEKDRLFFSESFLGIYSVINNLE